MSSSSIFPAQYSTLSAAALKRYIATAYNIEVLICRYLLRGVSDTYVLEADQAKYIFKVYRDQHRSLEEIKGEVELLYILKDAGASVSYPVADIFNSSIQKFDAAEGVRYGVLFTYAEGSPVYEFGDEQLKTIGRQMAIVHNVTSVGKLNYERKSYTIDTTLTQPLAVLEPAFADLPEEYAYLKQTAEQVIQKLNSFDTDKFSYGYCQYDFLPKNFHFNETATLTFFDFDFAGKGFLVNDLMSFFVHFFMQNYTGKITNEEVDRMFAVFIAGYRENRNLTDDELKAIPYLGVGFWIFYLGFQYQNFDDWSNPFFGPRFIKERVSLIQSWVNKYCEF
ncbi:phosphotransferase enzyme family protein [Mucilaginibacter sp. SP1R1]|uniref:phosphotransferase enzyme family protein n=1 Tax=Mucilaginibacter sp. SP1R1 TaxID=2723091 RepID=UPI0016112C9C|nr:phosphotransferase [Mucilaginibacter sp. SP1R1]MBB6150775.1 Ser/Thr protein kinase RdoA (MazF antagonist) [Mucilaginibacter sp. SP1R1]